VPDKDDHLEILSAHYSETYSLLKLAVEKRDRLFLYIVGMIFLLLIYMSAPSAVSDWLNLFISSRTGPNAAPTALLEASFIGTIFLLGLLSFSHTYFQTVLHIERQYDYVYQLEQQLSAHFGGQAFVREGDHYKKHRRRFSKWTKAIFWILFPALHFLFMIYWLIFLYTRSQAPLIFMIVDSLIAASILISLGLYLWALVKKK
jgi:hypothetical protein